MTAPANPTQPGEEAEDQFKDVHDESRPLLGAIDALNLQRRIDNLQKKFDVLQTFVRSECQRNADVADRVHGFVRQRLDEFGRTLEAILETHPPKPSEAETWEEMQDFLRTPPIPPQADPPAMGLREELVQLEAQRTAYLKEANIQRCIDQLLHLARQVNPSYVERIELRLDHLTTETRRR